MTFRTQMTPVPGETGLPGARNPQILGGEPTGIQWCVANPRAKLSEKAPCGDRANDRPIQIQVQLGIKTSDWMAHYHQADT